ncbi:MAG: sensor domain-containing diguanylate cyclase [Candidatus Omnitrophota bacterium]
MRCLILLIIVNIIYIAAVLVTVRTGENNFIFNFSLIPITIAAIFLKNSQILIIVAASLVLLVSFIIVGVDIAYIIETLIFLGVCAGGGYYLRYLTQRLLNMKEKVLDVLKEQQASCNQLNEKADADKLYLEKAVYNISSLYQAPKKMVSSTTLAELIDCLKKSVDGYFSFTKTKIIIFSFEDEEPKVYKIYNIPENDKEKAESGYEESLVNIMKQTKGPLVIDRDSDSVIPEGFVIPEDIRTFLAVPLIVGKRMNGIFVVEGVSSDDLVRFIILAHQFAMVLERIRLYEFVQDLAITDGLTGMFVRRYFLERLGEEIKRAEYFNTRLSFIMVDIDHFKQCNDKYGHLVGDVVLKRIAKILKENLREIDVIGRYGGEEFCILLPETTKDEGAVAGERLRKAVEDSRVDAYDETLKITISVGIAAYPDDTSDLNQLIDRADQMLYKAKEEGRNRVKVYE